MEDSSSHRHVTVEQIGYAVDLLPPRSQAFAAVLCDGTRRMMAIPHAQGRVRKPIPDASRNAGVH
jgi:hypothetical protein